VSITFEAKSQLSRIEKKAFYASGLFSITIPESGEVIGELCFCSCKSLTTVTFEGNSKLSRIEKYAFCMSGLRSIHIPGSVEVIGESCFSGYPSLKSITFDPHSKLATRLSELLAGHRLDCSLSGAIGGFSRHPLLV
jgi:hypothetical protein